MAWNGKIKVQEIAYHRNGVCGEPFYVIRFQWNDRDCGKLRNMIATYFEPENESDENGWRNPRCAVLDIDETAKGNIAVAEGNSWRGDYFSDELRGAIRAQGKKMTNSLETIDNLLAAIATRSDNLHAQIKELVAENKAMREALYEVEFIFDGQEDIKDGPEGQQLPNDAMRALQAVRRALYGGMP